MVHHPGPEPVHAQVRERVALAGGEVSAGPCPDGGWRLRALLPTEEGTEVEAEPARA